ncbi:uncharacterized protein [Haliotis cracherodii]|uniref:uncharacterized protein n=1 Tax=Haliotis cracherodii TaxID=6455 RepID=UPI0039EC5189
MMKATSEETHLKKRLQVFLAEMLKLGTVKGFKYFASYMRGREEMVISVVNEPQTPNNSYSSEPGTPLHNTEFAAGSSFTSNNLPYDKRSLMLSQRTQMSLSGLADKGVGLPPASPSDDETQAMDDSSTVFLIAGYTRYSCPYVWVRSNHERLVRLTGGDTQEKDNPLRLKSTNKWKDNDVCIWDIIAELVKLCTYPAPRNPFAVDIPFFSTLPLSEQVLSTAAMVSFLQKVLIHTPDDRPYAAKVFEDLQLVTKCHFSAVQKLAKEGGLPILHQQQQQQQQQRRKMSGGQSQLSSRKRYPSSGSQYPAQYGQYQQPTAGYSYGSHNTSSY